MEKINIEEIMQEIREEIKEKGYTKDELSFLDVPIKKNDVDQFNASLLESAMQDISNNKMVDYYAPIEGKSLKAIAKKIVRKLIKPIVYPMCEKQKVYNASVDIAINQLYLYMQDQKEKISLLETMLNEKKEHVR